jgi:hypothetical protein
MKSSIILCLFLFFYYSPSHAQFFSDKADAGSPEIYPVVNNHSRGVSFFASEELLEMTLEFDMKEFLRTKSQSKYQDAILTVKIDAGDSITEQIELRARGKMRCDYCSFPPIMLKLKEKDSTPGGIRDRGTFKLVTHCNRSPKNEDYVLKEYLVYRMLNLLTPYSFKTRLVRIQYRDTQGVKKSYTTYGFLIENLDQLAERNKAVVIDNPNLAQSHMNTEDMARTALFNYMIGNTDWSIASQHNVKVLRSVNVFSDKGIPISYDFDFSGFVNTSYAAPCGKIPIKNVTERYYQGMCLSDEDINPVLEQFEELKGLFLSTIDNFEYLSAGSRKQLEAYINSFYKGYKNQNVLISDLNRTCKSY